MGSTLTRLVGRSFDQPDEVRPFVGNGHLDVINLDGVVGRAVFEPGWKWSRDVKPIANTETCEAPHMGYVVSGAIHVEMSDGSAHDFTAGDVMSVPPGHDAWTLGSEPCVMIDWTGVADYAKR